MSKHQTIKINPGISVCLETMTVATNPLAFNSWPWSGKNWPCRTTTRESYIFAFEENGAHDITLVDISNPSGDKGEQDEAMLDAMANDCKAILVACYAGCGFAIANLMADRSHEAETIAKDAGWSAGRNSAEWFAQESFGGRTRDRDLVPNAKRFLAMVEEGDPEVFDAIGSPLSGEYSGDVTSKDVVMDALRLDDSGFDAMNDLVCALDMEDAFQSFYESLCNIYEDAYSESWQEKAIEIAKGIVDNDNEQKANA